MGELVQAELKVQEASFAQHPILRQNQLGRIYGLTHLAYQLYLSKEFLDVAHETLETVVWLLHQLLQLVENG